MSTRRRGLLRLAALLAVVAVAIVYLATRSGGRSGAGRTSTGAGAPSVTSPKPGPPPKLVARASPRRLPAPISGEAAVSRPGGVLSIGGLDSSTVSTNGVVELQPPSGSPRSAGSLAEPLHDAAAAVLAGKTLVFGGGSATTIDSVESLAPGGTGTIIGHLPVSRSDLSAASLGGHAFVLGGYDGTAPVAAVLETADGRRFTQIASLPTPVRYAAVATLGHTIYAFGGELADGQDTDVIQAIDTATHRAKVVGHLPEAISHASAVTLGGRIYVLGGSVGGTATDRIRSFDPGSGRIATVGKLPYPVSDAAAAALDGTGYLIGGIGAAGTTLDSVATVRLVPR